MLGALIEVRSGIHPQLTGRENIAMFGALLGLGRRQVAESFDEIVGFAELEQAIDRQTKFYSSGMQMRLGFAVGRVPRARRAARRRSARGGRHELPAAVPRQDALRPGRRRDPRARVARPQCGGGHVRTHDLAPRRRGRSRRHDRRSPRRVYRDGEAASAGGRSRGGPGADHEGRGFRTRRAASRRPTARSTSGCGSRVTRVGAVRLYVGLTEAVPSPIFVVERDFELLSGETEVRCRIEGLPVPRGRFAVWAAVLDEDGRDLVPWRPVAELDVMGPTMDPRPGAWRGRPRWSSTPRGKSSGRDERTGAERPGAGGAESGRDERAGREHVDVDLQPGRVPRGGGAQRAGRHQRHPRAAARRRRLHRRRGAIAASFAERTVVLRQDHRGCPSAWNLGLAHARGDFVTFCDSDDLWIPGHTGTLLEVLDARPEVDAVFGVTTEFVSPELDAESLTTRRAVRRATARPSAVQCSRDSAVFDTVCRVR